MNRLSILLGLCLLAAPLHTATGEPGVLPAVAAFAESSPCVMEEI